MKRKNEFLYEFIYEQLANGVKRTFVQIDEIAKQRLGDLYNQKQLRNLLYNLVSKNELGQDGNEYYCLCKKEIGIISEYLRELENICSASAIRNALKEKRDVSKYVPNDKCFKVHFFFLYILVQYYYLI